MAEYSGFVVDTSSDLGELLMSILGSFHKFHLIEVSTNYLPPRQQYWAIIGDLWLAMAKDPDIKYDVRRFHLENGAAFPDDGISGYRFLFTFLGNIFACSASGKIPHVSAVLLPARF